MLGALLSTVGGALLGHSLAKNRQEDSQDFSAQQFATRYQTTVQDMKAAGLNPMLAYSQGGGNPPSSSAASAQSVDTGQAYLQSKMNSAQVANIEADTANKQAQADLIQAQIGDTKASAWQRSADIDRIDMQTREIRNKLENSYYENDAQRVKALAQQLHSQYLLNIEQGKTQAQSRDLMYFQAQKLNAETDLLKLDMKAAEQLGNIGREMGQLKPVIDILLQIAGMRSKTSTVIHQKGD